MNILLFSLLLSVLVLADKVAICMVCWHIMFIDNLFLLQLVHAKGVVALVALEFLPAGVPRYHFKLAFGFAFWAFSVYGFAWQSIQL